MMKKLYCSIALLILFGGLTQSALAQPKIDIKTTHHNFGTTYPDQMMLHNFEFANKGDKPLIISKVTTTCGCAAAILAATTIMPSATSIVSVTMEAHAPAKKKESVYLYTNDPKNPKVMISLESLIRNLWHFSPKQVFKFPDLPFNQEQSMTMMLENIDKVPFKILATSVKDPALSVSTGEYTPEGCPVTVTLKAGTEKHNITDQVLIQTNHPNQPKINIQVLGRTVGFIKFNRKTVFFGSMRKGSTKKIVISANIIANSNAKKFLITDIQSDYKNIEGKVTGTRGDGSLSIELTYTAPLKSGYSRGTLSFHTNIEEEKVITLPFSAQVRN
jgi:uncharacterized protein DUF1573